MKSHVGHINKDVIRGWCFDETRPLEAVTVELYIDEEKLAETVANDYRENLIKKCLHSSGYVGFKFKVDKIDFDENSQIELRVKESSYVLNIDRAKEEFELYVASKKLISEPSTINRKRKLCIVHVGMHKTGSSSIQENLNRHQNKNFSYFDLGRKNHGIPLFSLFTEHPEHYHVHTSRGLSNRDIYHYNIEVNKMFRAHIYSNTDYETFVISGEDICVLSKRSLMDLKQYLLMFFKNIKIIAYVRSPVSYINSAFQQRVKEGRIDFTLENVYPQYRFKIEKFDMVFGSENVSLNYFHRDHLLDGDVIIDFLRKNKLEVFDEDFIVSNESLSLESVALLYVYYILGPGRKGAGGLIKSLEHFGTKKVKFGKEVLKPIIDAKHIDIMWMENRLNIKLLDEDNYSTDDLSINTEQDLINLAVHSMDNLKEFINDYTLTEEINGDKVKDIVKLLNILLSKSAKRG